MTNEEAIKILRDTPIDIRSTREDDIHTLYATAQNMAIDALSAEDVEVIQCKDCKYWQDNNGGYPNPDCRWNEQETPDADDFCSFGERREP